LLVYLSDRGIPGTDTALPAAVDGVAAIFGPWHKPLLDPAAFSPDQLVESMSQSGSDLDPAEAAEAVTDGLAARRTGIDALGDDDLLVITIG
jgi:hypothetical protein